MNPGSENPDPTLAPAGEQPSATAPQAPASTEAALPEAPLNADAQAMVDAVQATPVSADTSAHPPLTWQARLLEEAEALEAKLAKLGAFLRDQAHGVHPNELHLLYEQRRHMAAYLEVLKVRLQRLVTA